MIIGILDLISKGEHLELSREMTKWADQLIQLIVKKVEQEMGFDGNAFSIIGLGKMGGEDLTFGSDFDLIFVYVDDESITKDKSLKKLNSLDFNSMCHLVEKSVQEIQSTLGQVDLRLRPEGNKGALALTPQSFKEYFENRASFWERLAWMKGRYVAGNKKLAQKVLGYAEKFVYGTPVTAKTAKEFYSMRLRMQKNLKTEKEQKADIKVGTGGLADIEFTLQYLLMKYGYKEKMLRVHNLQDGLKKLQKKRKVNPKSFKILQENYLFFTLFQNRLRLMSNFSNNLIPESEIELRAITRLMNFSNSKELLDTYSAKANLNRKLFREIVKV